MIDKIGGTKVPAADTTLNERMEQAVGNKTDTGVRAVGLTASIIAYIKGLLEVKPQFTTPVANVHTTTTTTEEIVFTYAPITPGLFYMDVSLRDLLAGDDFILRLYGPVDGVNYDLISEEEFIGNQPIQQYKVEGIYCDADEHIQFTIQRVSVTDRSFNYRYSLLRQPVA